MKSVWPIIQYGVEKKSPPENKTVGEQYIQHKGKINIPYFSQLD